MYVCIYMLLGRKISIFMYVCMILAQAQKLHPELESTQSDGSIAGSIEVETMKDLAGHPRFVRVKYPNR